ncbi:MAG TPA: sugar phosphate isomerase/epimerase family protein [Verrucomicrobiae bacterium]|jgi:sugar phosphate isomerase/epimerase|nr:sugar phosphate isomerase/epimerase family protein [Verrucomicrobiae bacterium]
MKVPQINRRHFLHAGLLGSTLALAGTAAAAVVKPERKPDDGLKLGMASYTYGKFSLDQAIAMTKDAGLKYINLKPDFHLKLTSTKEERHAARAKIEAAGLTLTGGGVIYMKNNEEEIQNIFNYCVDAGMPVVVCSPEPDALDTVEKFAKQTGVMVAIHNHGPSDKTYPSPMDVYKMVKDRDPLMGICMDIGHTVRIGVDPVECINDCGERLHDMHLKDVTSATPKGKPVPVGRGVLDIVGIFTTLKARNFPYHIGLEYEGNPTNPQPAVRESIGYARGVLAAIG